MIQKKKWNKNESKFLKFIKCKYAEKPRNANFMKLFESNV